VIVAANVLALTSSAKIEGSTVNPAFHVNVKRRRPTESHVDLLRNVWEVPAQMTINVKESIICLNLVKSLVVVPRTNIVTQIANVKRRSPTEVYAQRMLNVREVIVLCLIRFAKEETLYPTEGCAVTIVIRQAENV
jgi:hypothetical protein